MKAVGVSPGWRVSAEQTQLLVIDVQERLLPAIHEHESVAAQVVRMVRIASELALPITISEQNPDRLGATVRPVRDASGGAGVLQKRAFSVCGETACLETLRRHDRNQVLLIGIETHVCVEQTALDLLAQGLRSIILADAVGSRRTLDRDIALARMRHAGVLVTTVEAAAFEMLRRYDTEAFRRVLPHLR